MTWEAKRDRFWDVATGRLLATGDIMAAGEFARGALVGLMIGDRHPEVVGPLLAEIMAGLSIPMPVGQRRPLEAIADSIALATKEEPT